MSDAIRVYASVTSDQPEIITRAVEAFGRAITGLALEGIEVWLSVRPDDDEDQP